MPKVIKESFNWENVIKLAVVLAATFGGTSLAGAKVGQGIEGRVAVLEEKQKAEDEQLGKILDQLSLQTKALDSIRVVLQYHVNER